LRLRVLLNSAKHLSTNLINDLFGQLIFLMQLLILFFKDPQLFPVNVSGHSTPLLETFDGKCCCRDDCFLTCCYIKNHIYPNLHRNAPYITIIIRARPLINYPRKALKKENTTHKNKAHYTFILITDIHTSSKGR
jgi:hypothetical protein